MKKTSPASQKKGKGSEVAPERESAAPVASQNEPDESPSRITMPVTIDGTIDTTRLRDRTKDALRKALLDPKLAESLGVANPSSIEDVKIMSQIANGLYDGLSALSIAMARRAGYTIDQASVLMFTPDEKSVLTDPTARVINKYLPDLGGKYRDELLLSFTLLNIIAAKVMILRSSSNENTVVSESETA